MRLQSDIFYSKEEFEPKMLFSPLEFFVDENGTVPVVIEVESAKTKNIVVFRYDQYQHAYFPTCQSILEHPELKDYKIILE